MSRIFFDPYIGEKYNNPKENIFGGKKILVVGHNHNCTIERLPKDKTTICRVNCLAECEGCKSKTNDIIEWIKDYLVWCKLSNEEKANAYPVERPNSSNTYIHFGKFLTDNERHYSMMEAYNSIAFYNYCQFAVSEWDKIPSKEQYEASVAAFNEVVAKYSPDLILCWSVNNVFCKLKLENVEIQYTNFGKKVGFGDFYFDTHRIPVIGIQHPMAFCAEKWHKFIFPQYIKLQ